MAENPSPLRYPGGKFKISRLVDFIIRKAGRQGGVYIEPFAGGAGVALDLLFSGTVDEIIINDADVAIASFWKAITRKPDDFIRLVRNTRVTIQEWRRQRAIYLASRKWSVELGFAAFFLNRTNHSGILQSGPIGGQDQLTWHLDVRYDQEQLIKKLEAIANQNSKIRVYNQDAETFLGKYLPPDRERAFIYCDPPYYRRGRVLYKNYYTHELHRSLAESIANLEDVPWIVSYDDAPQIEALYHAFPSRRFALSYSLANNGHGNEIIFFRDQEICPSLEEINQLHLPVWFDNQDERLQL